MLDELKARVQKAGQLPGTPDYTGENELGKPLVTVINYAFEDAKKVQGHTLAECLSDIPFMGTYRTWINVEGLQNIALIEEIAQRYNIHPLTVEDILNVAQRPKLEDFEHYYFVVLQMLKTQPISQDTPEKIVSVEQVSIIFGKDFMISFLPKGSKAFHTIQDKLCHAGGQRARQHGSDYLAYRLIDTVVDQYFIALEQMEEDIENLEDEIMAHSSKEHMQVLYQLRRQVLTMRKVIWPVREILSHLLQCDHDLVSEFTRTYVRDAYDHAIQAIDALENFRESLTGMLDVYLSSLSQRMNEVMKILTIISTIFIPITFIASIYGMNFDYMPELHWHWSYFVVLSVMGVSVITMLCYFRRKKWF